MSAKYDLDLAWSLAYKFHEGQKYGEHEYTVHLWQVTDSVLTDTKGAQALYQSVGAKQDFEEWFLHLRCVAVLHDILEDTPLKDGTLYALFPEWVVEAVLDLTKFEDMTDEDYMEDVKANPVARFVKLHDAKKNYEYGMSQGNQKRAVKYLRKMAELMETD